MGSSEKALRGAAKALIDKVDPDVMEFPWRWFKEVKAVKDILEAASEYTDLEGLVEWLEKERQSRISDPQHTYKDAREAATLGFVIEHIADEFGVMGGKKKTDD